MQSSPRVPFLDLKAQLASIRAEVDAAIAEVLDNTAFILGPAVAQFEEEFARQTGRTYAVGLNSGTSALHLALIAAGVGPGDEVITTPHTWISTTWAISYVGATPVFADVDPATGNLDPAAAEAAITERTKALLPVDLYGHPAALDQFEAIAARHGLVLIEDAAQAHLATLNGRPAGSFGKAACFSFYPGKNLGAIGEGGAVVTDDEEVAARIRRLRDHAQLERHHHVEVGYNYRMEGLQGAVLRVKLRHLPAWTERRRAAAARYAELLSGIEGVTLPHVADGANPVWHLYPIRVADRDTVQSRLAEAGVGTAVHYPTPVHLQPAYQHLGYRRGQFPSAEAYAATCLSLPMFAELTEDQQVYVAEQLQKAVMA
jgi:dTDP-4-amino-4,6-dideoxygalactose transaminase